LLSRARHRLARIARSLLLIVLFALGAAAPPAEAVEVTVRTGGTLVLADSTGVNNIIRLEPSGSNLALTDVAGVTGPIPPNCSYADAVLLCSGVPRIEADLGAGDDRWVGVRAPLGQEVYGGPGVDIFRGGPNGDRFTGGPGDDFLRGEAGPDILRGQGGNDKLVGGPSRDRLNCAGGNRDKGVGGQGPDKLTGCEDEQS
jgi:hypothetical protein